LRARVTARIPRRIAAQRKAVSKNRLNGRRREWMALYGNERRFSGRGSGLAAAIPRLDGVPGGRVRGRSWPRRSPVTDPPAPPARHAGGASRPADPRAPAATDVKRRSGAACW